MRHVAVFALLWALATPARADFIETTGKLSDDDFYRLVACGAPLGDDCARPFVRWPTDRPLRVGFARIERAYLGGKQVRARAALTRAVQYINAAGAGLRLEQTDAPDRADIRIYLMDTDGSAPLKDTGVPGLDGAQVRGAQVRLWWADDNGLIETAQIVFSTRLSIRHYESAMIEELTQALGFMSDIRNPLYDGVSVFSEDSNAAKVLGPQDIMALRRHYPPP